MIVQLHDRVKFLEKNDAFHLDSAEVIALRLTWNAFLAGDGTQRGFQMFTTMFNDNPDTKKIFPFAKGQAAEQLATSAKLLFHVTRVVSYITKAVDHADSLQDVVPILKQAGGRHGDKGYKVPKAYLPMLGAAMIKLMKKDLSNFSSVHEKLWNRFFGFITDTMMEGMDCYGK